MSDLRVDFSVNNKRQHATISIPKEIKGFNKKYDYALSAVAKKHPEAKAFKTICK